MSTSPHTPAFSDPAHAAPPARERVLIFDTTLRDGEQAPGCSMTRAQKLRMARVLEELGVDIIEAGFPAASEVDAAAVAAVAGAMRRARIGALARCQEGDIVTAARALEAAAQARIHLFLATSPIHREHKLHMSKAQVLDTAVAAVRRACALCGDVEFSAEDALRTEPEFLIEVFTAVIAAGARTINVPDTVGYTTPAEIAALFARLRREVVGIERAVLSTHCHDDLGMGVANSLAAIEAGARQVECTLNGIGERAGNAALEEVVMALRTRADRYALDTGIDSTRLYAASRALSGTIGLEVARNKAIVGDNAFAHEAGIHQHGMLVNRTTYEIMRPEDVGFPHTRLVLGRHSGRHALRERISTLGLGIDDARFETVFTAFKTLAESKREVLDADVEALVLGTAVHARGPWMLAALHVGTYVGGASIASLHLRHVDGREARETATGSGPVHAVTAALVRASGLALEIIELRVRSIGLGAGAQGEAVLRVQHDAQELRGRGTSTDIVEAAALAMLEVVNRIERTQPRALANPTHPHDGNSHHDDEARHVSVA
ncbi:2-isopropylmalate synthase [Metallibacterium sp.]|jgi:2-isopropylmalate synthase|uniref:2-isopropylmalate synthase n=1 Tax=Metallibacterium sp. TaxID=2940281 RepID=UPI00260E72B5|nr:2-isopropylmalate synthase [Metallibacterium sp.]